MIDDAPIDLGTNLGPVLTGDDRFAPRSPDLVLVGLDAIAAAGYTSVLPTGGHVAALAAAGLDPAAEIAARGLRTIAVEAVLAWATNEGDTRGEGDGVLALAEAAGASMVIAVAMSHPLAASAAEALGALADRAHARGITMCVEFLPWSPLATLAGAWEFIAPIPHTTLLLDAWHWHRQPGGPQPDVLAAIPPERIGLVQLSDASATPGEDVLAETMTARLLPGEGVIDYAGFFAAIDRCGARPPIAVEIFNPDLVEGLGTAETARRSIAAARAVIPAGWR